MCTVAFLLEADGGYLLGHNRDEGIGRERGLPPRLYRLADRSFLAPRDPEGGGTWIGVNDTGLTLGILNAAEPEPSRLPPEPTSRGRVLWDLLPLDDVREVERRLEADRNRLATVRAFDLVAAELGDASTPARAASPACSGFVIVPKFCRVPEAIEAAMPRA